jgi:hypothetical protein
MKELDFESVNAEIERLDLTQFDTEMRVAAQAEAFPAICKVWNTVGGIVKLVAKIPLIPRKWRDALNLLIHYMDSICG